MTKSELPGFYRLSMRERRERVAELCGIPIDELRLLSGEHGLSEEQAEQMVENALGVMGMPFGLCVNLRMNGRDRLVPMAVEEPSVIAACSHAAKLLRAGGGLDVSVSAPLMVGQIQLLDVPDAARAEEALRGAKNDLLELANAGHPQLVAAGGGAVDIEVRELPRLGETDPCGPMFIVHVVVDVRDAMGANAINSMCERIAPRVASLTGGRVGLRILSNLCDRRIVTARGRVPFDALVGKGAGGPESLARGIEEASVFAERDPYRAATHNKGIMNGVDAVLVAFGQDWRAVEAGAHAHASHEGRYTALARWRVRDGALHGELVVPMAVGTVGGIAAVHPVAALARRVSKVEHAADLAGLTAAVGLAQNLGALRALAAEGIQLGHMRLHARNVAFEAGAVGEEVERVAALIAEARAVNVPAAREVLVRVRAASMRAGEATTEWVRRRFRELGERYAPRVMGLIEEIVRGASPEGSSLADMCGYHMETGGKRLRALLPMLVAEALGSDPAELVPLGAACEMLHNATLVHDDLQDGDATRRGRATVWARFGQAQAINLGDAMFYYTLLLSQRLSAPVERRELCARRVLLDTLRVIDGQEREFILKQATEPTLTDYFLMVEGKTSGLFALPVAGAAELCGAQADVVEGLVEAARHMGVIFQIQDDVLDLYGEKGRDIKGSDICEGKRSVLAVHALTHGTPDEVAWLRAVLDKPRDETTIEEVARATALFERLGSVDFALREIAARRARALGVPVLDRHPRLRELVAGVCDLFLEPIRPLVEARETSSGSPTGAAPAPAVPSPGAGGGGAASAPAGSAPAAAPVRPPVPAPIPLHGPKPSAEDEAFSRRLLPLVSRTFALSIEALPSELRDAVRVSYLLCRVVDSIEDEAGLAPRSRVTLFDRFDGLMADDRSEVPPFEELCRQLALGGARPERELCQGAGAVFRCFRALPRGQREAIRPHVLEMSRGMREYTARADAEGKLRLRDLADLERYCYFVAGTVGELLTSLFEQQVPGLDEATRRAVRQRAVQFGLGLQFVNILKDVASDYGRGDCYLPTALASEHRLDLERLLEPTERTAALTVLRALTARARVHLEKASEYTALWPAPQGEPVRMFCAVPLALALATLREVERGEDALRRDREPKISRARVEAIFTDAKRAVASNAALTTFLAAADEPTAPAPTVGATVSVAHTRVRAARPPVPDLGAARRDHDTDRSSPMTSPNDSDDDRASTFRDRHYAGRVLVTGAAGHLGANLVRRLLDDGREVRTLLRHGSNNEAVEELEVERVFADLRDYPKLLAAVRGSETVYHVAAKVSTNNATAREEREIYDCNVTGTQNLLRACLETGVKRVVVSGSLSAVGRNLDDPTRPSDETMQHYPFEDHMPYGRTKVLVEHESLKAMADGLDVVIATSCAILGPHDYKPSRMGRTLIDYAHGRLRAYLPGGFEFVATRDIVEGHVLAMRRGRTGHKYVISTEFMTVDQIMDLFEEVTGRPRPRLRLPPALMAGIAEVSSFVFDNFFPDVPQRFTPNAVRVLRSERRADIGKARRELGYEPTGVRHAVHEAYADFARRGLVPASGASVALGTVLAAAGKKAAAKDKKREGAAA